MTKEELFKLRKISSEIEQIKQELQNIEPEYAMDSVTGSSINFPYTQHQVKIEGYDINNYESKIRRIKSRLSSKMMEFIEEKDRLTEYIYGLENSDLRQILMYRYINGLTWEEIGPHMKYATSTIRLKHDNFLKKNSTF